MARQDEPDDTTLITALSTEHFTLQTARSAVIADSSSRTSQFLTTVSAALVALAFVAQITGLGAGFYAFALIVLPVLAFLGVATVVRVVQLSVEDQLYGLAIARIRGYYAEIAGDRRDLLLLAHAHRAGRRADAVLADLGSRRAGIQALVATPASVAVVTAVLVGGVAGIGAIAGHATFPVAVGAGVLGALVALAALLVATIRLFGRAEAGLTRLAG